MLAALRFGATVPFIPFRAISASIAPLTPQDGSLLYFYAVEG